MNILADRERKWVVDLIHDKESAFIELYALYKDRLISFAVKFLKSKELAEDVFHDTFAVVWQNRHGLDPDASFSSYVYTIMRNRILNMLARIDREVQLKENILSYAIDLSCETENEIIDADLGALLDKVLQQLTPQQKNVFELSRKELKSHKEIAVELGISVYTVQQHISASLKVIRACLDKYAGFSAGTVLFLVYLNI